MQTELVDFTVEVETGKEPRILQLTDPQIADSSQLRPGRSYGPEFMEYYAPDHMERLCFSYIREVIEETKPDLILVTGDLVYGTFDDNGTALQAFVAFMDGFGIPWAPVFGNHDNECAKGVDWQCKQLKNAEYCLFKQRNLTGNGNYTVGIVQDGELKRVFFMLDSNGCFHASSQSMANGHTVRTAGFGADQIQWYTETARKIKELSSEIKFTFAFHIQLDVFKDAYAKYGFVNSYDGTYKAVNIDTHSDKRENDFGYLGAPLKNTWDTDRFVYNGLKELGVDSILVGHEHCNSGSVVHDGIRFQYGQKSSTYDRANYVESNGTITGMYYGDISDDRKPLVGGTVMSLSKEDGTIQKMYII